MTLQIGATAPDFEAETTEGPIHFHDWIGDSWAVLFSHPKNFTPVCTTELGYMASIKPEFDRRNVKIIGLSVDPVDGNARVGQGHRGDPGHRAQLPDHQRRRLQASPSSTRCCRPTPAATRPQRTPADNQTVRNVFVIGPDKKIKLILVYPMTTGRNFDEVLRVVDSLQLTANHKVSTPAQWQQGDDVIIAGSVSNDQAKEIFGELGVAEALHPHRAAARGVAPVTGRLRTRPEPSAPGGPCAPWTVRPTGRCAGAGWRPRPRRSPRPAPPAPS